MGLKEVHCYISFVAVRPFVPGGGGHTLLFVKNRLELEILLRRKKAIMLTKSIGVG